MTRRSPPSYIVPALKHGIGILRLFTREQRVWNAPEVARHVKLPRATVHRLLRTLEELDLLERMDGRSHDFRLGIGVLALGFEYLNGVEIVERARPLLERLRDETRCSAHLAIHDRGDVVYIARHTWPGVVTASIAIGARVPAYAIGLGRLFLMDLSRPQLDVLYGATKLRAFTAKTPATIDALAKLLSADRGYVIERSMYASGVVAISAPIRDGLGKVSAAVSVTSVEGALGSPAAEGRVREAVLRAAHAISTPYGGSAALTED
jgi:DNA-binding IclR family transcriptional regulator